MQVRELKDLKAQTVPSWLNAFQDFHSQSIADSLRTGHNTSRLAFFLKGQFFEHGLFGYQKDIEQAIHYYKRGSLIQDPLSCYRLAEAFSHMDNPLKVTPDFEENVYFQAMTIAFMHLYYGVPIFDCLAWYENYLTIDPELSTMKQVISSRMTNRLTCSPEFENVYQLQNLILQLLSMRKSPDSVPVDEADQDETEEKLRVQVVYNQTVEFLIKHIERRGSEAIGHQSSFAYETLLHLLSSESLNANKLVENCLQTLIKFPKFLASAVNSLAQEIDIMILQEKDNIFFSHMRFVLIEMHNILRVLIATDQSTAENQPIVDGIIKTLKQTFWKIYQKRHTGLIREHGEIVFIIRHLADLESSGGSRSELETAIRIQKEELANQSGAQSQEQLAFCHYKLGSLRKRIVVRRHVHHEQFLHQQQLHAQAMINNNQITGAQSPAQFHDPFEQTFAKKDTSYDQRHEVFLDCDGNVCSEGDYYEEQSSQSKASFDEAERLYEVRTKNMLESPLAKLLGTYYLGRIHQKHKQNDAIASRHYLKALSICNSHANLLNNCRTIQFQIIKLKAQRRLNSLPEAMRAGLDQENLLNQSLVSQNQSMNHQQTIGGSRIGGHFESDNILDQSLHSHDNGLLKSVHQNTLMVDSRQGSGVKRVLSPSATFQSQLSQRAMMKLEESELVVSYLRQQFNHEVVKEIPAREIRMKSMLRKGQFGSVHSIQYEGHLYAGKLIQFVRRTFFERVLIELKQNLLIEHESILPTLAVSKWPSDKTKKGPDDPIHVLLIMDQKRVCLEQTLREHLILSPVVAYRIAQQICSGLNALHLNGVAHTNLKLQNVLLDGQLNAFITDWGVSHLFSTEINRNLDEFTSAIAFTAPELQVLVADTDNPEDIAFNERPSVNRSIVGGGSVRVQKVKNDAEEGKHADIWSLGVIFLCLFFDFFPNEKSIQDINLYTGFQLQNYSQELSPMHTLVSEMLSINPIKRPTSQQVQQRLATIVSLNEYKLQHS